MFKKKSKTTKTKKQSTFTPVEDQAIKKQYAKNAEYVDSVATKLANLNGKKESDKATFILLVNHGEQTQLYSNGTLFHLTNNLNAINEKLGNFVTAQLREYGAEVTEQVTTNTARVGGNVIRPSQDN